jgi:hypothetical protein
MTHQGLRGVILLLAVLAILAAGIASVRFAPTLYAAASQGLSHSQLANECPSAYSHC